jgi:predicted DNA-binding transcriptional regulator AlpA
MTQINDIPATGFLRQADLLGVAAVSTEQADANRTKGTGVRRPRTARRGLLPFSNATLWRKVAAGEFPAPVKLSNRVTAWRCEDVRAWMEQLDGSPRKVA